MMVSVEKSVEWKFAGEIKVLAGNVPQCHFVHHKSHLAWDQTRAAETGRQRLTAWAMARPKCYRRWIRRPVRQTDETSDIESMSTENGVSHCSPMSNTKHTRLSKGQEGGGVQHFWQSEGELGWLRKTTHEMGCATCLTQFILLPWVTTCTGPYICCNMPLSNVLYPLFVSC
jgi:hypothetical protein